MLTCYMIIFQVGLLSAYIIKTLYFGRYESPLFVFLEMPKILARIRLTRSITIALLIFQNCVYGLKVCDLVP